LFIDVGATALSAGLTASQLVGAREPGSTPLNAAGWMLGLSTALPVLVWRRRPRFALLGGTAILVVYYAAGFPGFPPAAPLSVASFLAALSGRGMWAAVPVVVLSLIGVFVTGVREHGSPADVISGFVPAIGIAITAVVLGDLVRSRRALAAETRERIETESARRVAEERLRIAQELHDTVAHGMATIAVQAGGGLRAIDERPSDTVSALQAIRQTSRDALAEMRATLGVLRQGRVERETGLDRLPQLFEAVRAAGLPLTLDVTECAAGPEVSHVAYRIIQESLTNVLRHGGHGVAARVRLTPEDRELVLEVADDGREPPGAEGNGVRGMRERAESVGGTFKAGPAPEGGFQVTARLPL
jgi:signal transduction histidine kinase